LRCDGLTKNRLCVGRGIAGRYVEPPSKKCSGPARANDTGPDDGYLLNGIGHADVLRCITMNAV
jgi:hypothetical protein